MSEPNPKRDEILNLWAAGNCSAEIGRAVDIRSTIVEGIVRRARKSGDPRAVAVSAADRAKRIARSYITRPLTAKGRAAISASSSKTGDSLRLAADERVRSSVTENDRLEIIAMLQRGVTMVDIRRKTGRGTNTVWRIRDMARRSGELHPHVLPYQPYEGVDIEAFVRKPVRAPAMDVAALVGTMTVRLNMSEAEERQVASYMQRKPQTLRMEALRIVRGDMAKRAQDRRGAQA